MPSIEELETDFNLLDAESSLDTVLANTNESIRRAEVILEFLNLEQYEELQQLLNDINMLTMTENIIKLRPQFTSILKNNLDFQELCLEYIEELSAIKEKLNIETINCIVLELSFIYTYKNKHLERILNIYNNGVKSIIALLPRPDSNNFHLNDIRDKFHTYDLIECGYIINSSLENLSVSNLVALKDNIELNNDFFSKFFDV